ncbi:glycoprotein integral membrane protein 1 [Gracilinanus agilis]|uniref:glycoprotein integral membrane protein 1 n=1 Tax=Gracilinanus agilis TaxID=191870 RepID=UPI001CFCC057|nr:glycoprotein integral membrane protein 1 [Gracilinanus agilis]
MTPGPPTQGAENCEVQQLFREGNSLARAPLSDVTTRATQRPSVFAVAERRRYSDGPTSRFSQESGALRVQSPPPPAASCFSQPRTPGRLAPPPLSLLPSPVRPARSTKMEGAPLPAPLLLLLFLLPLLPAPGRLLAGASEPPSAASFTQDNIKINVTTLEDDGELHEKQVFLNIIYENGQIYVNDFPLKSGVTRIRGEAFIVEDENLEDLKVEGYFGTVSIRILVHQWPVASSSNVQMIAIQEEVVDIDGKEAQQKVVIEVGILVKNHRVHRRSNYSVPLEESILYSIPRDNDVFFTFPHLSQKDSPSALQTTSQYLVRNVETTINEDPLPGKLPETPLRAEPPSSYKVICQLMEDFRKYICKFWINIFPVLFMFMNITVLGIIGAAIVIAILKVLFPHYESKGILHLDKVDYHKYYPIDISETTEEPKDTLEEKICI